MANKKIDGSVEITGDITLSHNSCRGGIIVGTSSPVMPASTDQTITLPTASATNTVVLYAAESASSDYGILACGSDGIVIASSGDSGYCLKVMDKDTVNDYTTTGNGMLFAVGQTTSTMSYLKTPLTVTSSVTASSFYATSDRRMKDNIIDTDLDYLKLINKLELKEFNFKTQENKDDKYLGLIAQQLEEELPERFRETMISKAKDENHTLSINEGKVQYLTMGAVQQLSKKIESLEKENKELKETIEKINEKLDALLQK